MKTLTLNLLFVVIFSSFFTVEIITAQESTNLAMNFETDNESTKAVYSFAPNKKLSNEEIWDRVSEDRFECSFLRLAVEYRNNEYFLLEMDGDKRLLARDIQYATIVKAIADLTLNN